MLKKSLFVGAALTLLMALCFGRNAMSYVKTTVNRVSDTVKNSVPIDYEIDHARQMIKDLGPEIRKNMHLIAKEEIQVEHLEQRVAHASKQLRKDREAIYQLKAAIDEGGDYCVLVGRQYPLHQVKTDLSNRFERYKTVDETAFNLRKVLDARQRTLDGARQKLNGMLAAKAKLEVDVENLEARMKMVEVAQTTSEFNFDDSHLARTKELIRDIQTRIQVSERLLNAESDFGNGIPLDIADEDDINISDQITEYFSRDVERAVEVPRVKALAAEFSLN